MSEKDQIGPPQDSASVLRVGELTLAALKLESRLEDFSPPPNDNDPLAQLSAGFSSVHEVLARHQEVTPKQVLDIVRVGGAVVTHTDNAWWVATQSGVVRLRTDSEESSALTTDPLMKRRRFQALLTERNLGLESLSQGQTGSKNPWARLRALVQLESGDVRALALYAIVLGGLSLAVPVAVQVLVNTIALGALLQPLVVLSTLLCAVLVLSASVQALEWFAIEVLQRRLFVRVAEDFARRLPLISRNTSANKDLRELSNRFFEIATVQKSTGLLLIEGLGLTLQTGLGLLLLAFYHPVLLAFDVFLILALVGVLWLGRGAVDTAVSESAAKYKLGAWLQNIASNPVLASQESAQYALATVADRLTRRYLTERRNHYQKVFRQLVAGIGTQVIAMVALLGLGGFLVIKGELTLGQLVAAELVVGAVGAGFVKLGKLFEVAYDLLAGVDKLGAVLDLPIRVPSIKRAPLPAGTLLRLDNVELLGPLRHSTKITANIRAGSRVWLLGSPGSGKSVLLETIAGLREPVSGKVIFALHEESIGRLSEVHLFRPGDVLSGTVFFNLQLSKPDLSEEEAWYALQQVKLDAVIAALPQGLYTEIGAAGATLSTSQIARVAAARALLARPKLLLIDSRFSDMGLRDEEQRDLVDALFNSDSSQTIIIASDELEIGAQCSQILELPAAPNTTKPQEEVS